MPVSPPAHTSTLVVAAAAGAAAGAAALAWGVAHWQRRRGPHPGDAAAAPGTWTCAQVAGWLRDNGVAKAAVAVLVRYDVDGDALMRLTPQELYRIGVPLRDARMILAAIEDVRESVVLLSRASPRSMSRQQSSPSPRGAEALSEPSSAAQFEAAWRALIRTCAQPPSGASAAEQRQRLAVYTGALLESFQVLSPSEQAAALTLVAAAESVPLPPPPAAPPLRAADDAAPAADRGETPAQATEEKLAPLHKMLDGFLDFLRSPDLDAVTPADFEELGERVATQVKRIARVAEQLPPRLSAPLMTKCDGVFAALASRTSSASTPSPAASAAAAAAAAAPAASAGDLAGTAKLMQALHHVLVTVEDPALRELPAAQRVQTLAALAKRTEAIEAAAAGAVAGMPADEEVLSMVRPILRVIRQAVLLSEEEAAALARSSTAPAATAGDDAERMIPVLLETVQEIQHTLHSEAFREAPAAVRRELCEVMQRRVTELTGSTESLPVAAQTMVRELLSNTSSVLDVVVTTAEVVEEAGEEAEEAEGEDAEGSADGDAAEAAEGEDGAAASADIDMYVDQLERIFDFLTSDELEGATLERRREVAAKLLQRVATIRAEVEKREAHGAIITELITPLQELLANMAGTHAPSKEFVEVTAPLADVRRLLAGDAYQQLPHQEQLRIARTLIPQLQQLTAGFASLSEPERLAAEEMVRPINDELVRVVRPRGAGASTNTVQSVLERLQAVMRATQDVEFTTMSPAARRAWAVNTVAELGRVRDDCVALGAEGAAVLPIIESLQSQLRGLVVSDTAAAAAAGEEGERDDTRNGDGASPGPLWVAVREMTRELEAASETQAAVPPARLQRMLGVVCEASHLAGISAAQEATLLRFGALLRRHVESAVGDDANGEGGSAAQGEGDAIDAGADAEALESLRQSLQALAEVAQDGTAPTAPELSAMAASAEDLIAGADAVGLSWRQDAACASAVRSILGALQQSRDAAEGAAGPAREASTVESVLQSSITAIRANAPARREDFAPYTRLLELAQPSAEQMTNRELLLLKTLQEAVIEAMRRLPPPAEGDEREEAGDDAADAEGRDGSGGEEGEEGEEEEDGDEDGDEDASRVEAVLDALLQMSYKLREGTFSAEELDAFERTQQDLERLLAGEGVEAAEAMEAVREQIRLQRSTLADDEDDDGAASGADAKTRASDAAAMGRRASDAPHPESTHAFNEDDDDGAGSNGGGPGACGPSPSAAPHAAQSGAANGASGSHNGGAAH